MEETIYWFVFADFATRILEEMGGPTPRVGKKSDQAHPPIHPLKMANSLAGKSLVVWYSKVQQMSPLSELELDKSALL